jgi:hypothetical protein
LVSERQFDEKDNSNLSEFEKSKMTQHQTKITATTTSSALDKLAGDFGKRKEAVVKEDLFMLVEKVFNILQYLVIQSNGIA